MLTIGYRNMTKKPVQERQRNNTLTLNTFTKIPDEIDGCGCYFYLSEKDEKKERYIFVNDFASVAFVSVKSKLQRFELKKHKEGSSEYLYSNGAYQLKVQITEKKTDGEESSRMKGIIILSKGKSVLHKAFVGSCGC